ncbi:MAG: hypothetical protein K6D94_10510 [Clostridiales bacterium]|nr:hypothetical protein [Clostridiales bacterium]
MKKTNGWKTAFFVLLTVFIITECLTLIFTIAPGIKNISDIGNNAIGNMIGNLGEYNIGETVNTENWKISVEKVSISSCISTDRYSSDFLLPTYEEQYVRSNTKKADEGKTYVCFVFSIQYIGKEKTVYHPIIDIDYNNGYLFSDTTWYNCTDDTFPMLLDHYLPPFEPLSRALEIRGYCEVPLEVSENTDAPLKLIFRSVDGSDYTYRIR